MVSVWYLSPIQKKINMDIKFKWTKIKLKLEMLNSLEINIENKTQR